MCMWKAFTSSQHAAHRCARQESNGGRCILRFSFSPFRLKCRPLASPAGFLRGFISMNNQPPAVITINLPRLPVRLIGVLAVIAVILIVLWTSYYTVAAESEGVVLRFGKFLKTVGARGAVLYSLCNG